MGRLLTFLTLAVVASPGAYAQNGNDNGARVGKTGFLLNLNAFEKCPRGEMGGSQRRAIAVQADFTGVATEDTARVNKIFVGMGSDFVVQDGNACDQNGASFELPAAAAGTQYQVRARVLGKPRGRATITSCREMLEIDPVTQAETATSLCSVGAENVFVGTRTVGEGAAQNRWTNVSPQLLTVCVDKTGDGACDARVGLFDSNGRDYWWSVDNGGRPHVQLVFLPVPAGPGPSADPPPEPTPDPTPEPTPDPTPDPGPILK